MFAAISRLSAEARQCRRSETASRGLSLGCIDQILRLPGSSPALLSRKPLSRISARAAWRVSPGRKDPKLLRQSSDSLPLCI